MTTITFHYVHMQNVVDFALDALRSHSPVGSGKDPHSGLYRDSHTVFMNGHSGNDVSDWKIGDEVEISNPVLYSRKIEVGNMQMSVPGTDAVYQHTLDDLRRSKFGNLFRFEFTYRGIINGGPINPLKAGRSKAHNKSDVRFPALLIR